MTREIRQSDERLGQALRRLGEAGNQSAPPELYSTLAGAFRTHHIRRRRTERRRMVLAAVACLALGAALLAAFRNSVHGPGTNAQQGTIHLIPPQRTEIAEPLAVAQASHRDITKAHGQGSAPKSATAEDFIALPAYDPTMKSEGLRIVRLEGRGSDLRLTGAPISEELADRRVVADFVVGHDGTPYAVRFVQ